MIPAGVLFLEVTIGDVMNPTGGFLCYELYTSKVRTDPPPLRVVKSGLPKHAKAGHGLRYFPFTH